VSTTANAASTIGLPCLPKHGEAKDNKFFLGTLSMMDQRCLTSEIARRSALTTGPSSSLKGYQRHILRYSSETPIFYQIDLALRNIADVTGGKLSGVQSQPFRSKRQMNELRVRILIFSLLPISLPLLNIIISLLMSPLLSHRPLLHVRRTGHYAGPLLIDGCYRQTA
jgi:hypothetical protein